MGNIAQELATSSLQWASKIALHLRENYRCGSSCGSCSWWRWRMSGRSLVRSSNTAARPCECGCVLCGCWRWWRTGRSPPPDTWTASLLQCHKNWDFSDLLTSDRNMTIDTNKVTQFLWVTYIGSNNCRQIQIQPISDLFIYFCPYATRIWIFLNDRLNGSIPIFLFKFWLSSRSWLRTCVRAGVLLKISRSFEGLATVELLTTIGLLARVRAGVTLQTITLKKKKGKEKKNTYTSYFVSKGGFWLTMNSHF